jgi:glycosyltransferase involved in cell wall biosynthesis
VGEPVDGTERLLLVSEHAPELEGTASGRVLRAVADGLVSLARDVRVVCWSDRPPTEELPSWASWHPIIRGHALSDHVLAVPRPRWASSRLALADEGLSVAEDPLSFAAVAAHQRTAAVVHFSVLLDAQALRAPRLRAVQGHRADLRALRRATVPLTYSQRVAARWGGTWIPCGVTTGPALPLVDAPRALLLAGWDWAPNRAALRALLREWPTVVERVPAAELLLAGRGAPLAPGTTSLGEVPTAREAFAQAAVLAFPCPASTGPKVKVLEAMAAGLPVVTTPDGVEGLHPAVAAAAEVVPLDRFAAALAGVLASPERRAELSRRGHEAVELHHSPRAAATARIAALR